jgi:hypothetical protein
MIRPLIEICQNKIVCQASNLTINQSPSCQSIKTKQSILNLTEVAAFVYPVESNKQMKNERFAINHGVNTPTK